MIDKITTLKNMLVQAPHDCFLWHALGLEYIKRGELIEAITSFKQVLAADKNYVGTYYHLARTYVLTEQINLAIETYEQGIQIAQQLNDKHALQELRMALEDME